MILKEWQEEILKREINGKRKTDPKDRPGSNRSSGNKEQSLRR